MEKIYKGWFLVIPPDASEFFEWEFLEFVTEDEAKAEALKRKLEERKDPEDKYFVVHKQMLAELIREYTMSPQEVLEKYGQKQKEIVDKNIAQVISETQDEEDAVQYVDDIVYDVEQEIGTTFTDEQEEELVKYIRSEIARKYADKE